MIGSQEVDLSETTTQDKLGDIGTRWKSLARHVHVVLLLLTNAHYGIFTCLYIIKSVYCTVLRKFIDS